MFDTISISELQRSASKVFRDNTGVTYVLSNNKKKGLVLGEEVLKILEEMGLIQQIEDYIEMYEMSQNQEKLKKELQTSKDSGLSDLVI